jgi:hypothetical protein
MQTCDYAGTECYQVKTVPAIYEIDQTEGYVTGGQIINVRGFGFGRGTITPTIEGVECKVLSQSADGFSCRAGAADAPTKFTNSEPVVDAESGEPVLVEETGEQQTTETPISFVG